MTIMTSSFDTTDFTEAVRTHVLEQLRLCMERMSDFRSTGGFMDLSAFEKLELMSQDVGILSLDEIREQVGVYPFWDIRQSIPDEMHFPANVSFQGTEPSTAAGHVRALGLGLQLGKAWPGSTFVLTLEDSLIEGRGEMIRATAVRDRIRFQVEVDDRSLSVMAEQPHTFLDEAWEEIVDAYALVIQTNSWSIAAEYLETARSMAIMSRGIRTAGLDALQYVVDPASKTVCFTLNNNDFRVSATEAFIDGNDNVLPPLIIDAVFAEIANAAGFAPTTAVGREKVGMVFAGL